MQSTNPLHPTVEALEDRDVAAVDAFIQGNTLLIAGTAAADSALLFNQGNRLVLRQPGVADQFFPLSAVRNIDFRGLTGADSFLNLSTLRANALGGPGDDLLFGGTVRDRLLGESGNDLLVGNPTSPFFNGGGGVNFTTSPLSFALSGGFASALSRFSDVSRLQDTLVLQSALSTLRLDGGSATSLFGTSGGLGLAPLRSTLTPAALLSPVTASGLSSPAFGNPDGLANPFLF
jgi:Ca2+-binding RTX toxin-like protein